MLWGHCPSCALSWAIQDISTCFRGGRHVEFPRSWHPHSNSGKMRSLASIKKQNHNIFYNCVGLKTNRLQIRHSYIFIIAFIIILIWKEINIKIISWAPTRTIDLDLQGWPKGENVHGENAPRWTSRFSGKNLSLQSSLDASILRIWAKQTRDRNNLLNPAPGYG